VHARLHTDGGARGNPGPAGIGVVLEDGDGTVVEEVAEPLGATTNNVAEYTALIRGLELAARHGASTLDVYVDSELLVQQLSGRWKIRNDRLRALAVRASELLGRFERATITHVRRDHNARADALANEGMDAAEEGHDPGGQGSLMA
jgi:ribonuclease HI